MMKNSVIELALSSFALWRNVVNPKVNRMCGKA